MSMLIDAYRFAGSTATFHDVLVSYINALGSPTSALYFRLGEASGTNANNESGGSDATYSGGYTLGNAALYSGGPTSYAVSANTARVSYGSPAAFPSLTNMTLGVIVKMADDFGNHFFINRDDGGLGGSRYFQFRSSGTDIQFLRLTGGIQTVTRSASLVSGVPVFVSVSYAADGTVKIFKNGLKVGTDAAIASGLDFGAGTTMPIVVGNYSGLSDADISDAYSEAFILPTVLSEAQMLALAQAAGFA